MMALVVPAVASAGAKSTKKNVGAKSVGKSAKSVGKSANAKPARDYPWCAPEVEALSGDTCYIDGAKRGSNKRTLVVFLHGAIAKHTDWSWTQERALLRQAKAAGFEAIFPRAPDNGVGYTWPGGPDRQKLYEDALITGWKRSIAALEKKRGARYDEVFVMGFSSGAYYVSSLVQRGRLDGTRAHGVAFHADGFATFAGGSIGHQRSASAPKVPVYVGICSADRQTVEHSRGFAGELATRGFPSRAEEQPVGHMFADSHVLRAVKFLREKNASGARASLDVSDEDEAPASTVDVD